MSAAKSGEPFSVLRSPPRSTGGSGDPSDIGQGPSPKKTSRSPTTGVWFTTVTPKVGGPSAESVASNVRSGAFAGVSFGSSPTLAVFCASKKRRGQLSTAGASVVVVTVLMVVVAVG